VTVHRRIPDQGGRGTRVPALAAAALMLVCSACSTPTIRYSDGTSDNPAEVRTPVASIPPEKKVTPPPKPEPSESETAGSEQEQAERDQLAALPDPVRVGGDPDRLIGMNRYLLPAALGAPMLVRQDGPSEVWQYEAAGCVLDIFLFRANAGAELAVIHVESRDKNGEPVNTSGCLEAVEDNRVPVPTS